MAKKNFEALFILITAVGLLLLGNLFVIVTEDSWGIFGTAQTVVSILFFLMFPIYGWLCYRFGIYRYVSRHTRTIKNVYRQTEPHEHVSQK